MKSEACAFNGIGPRHARVAPLSWRSGVLSILIALVPLSFSIEPSIKVLPVALLFLSGLALLARAPVRASYRVAGPVLGVALLLVLLDGANVLAHRLGWRPLDHAAHVLLYLVVAAAFARPLRMRLVWGGFSLTAIALGLVCVVQHHVLGIDRAYGLNGGDSGAIEFATVLLGLALMALVQLLQARPGSRLWLLHGAGLLLGTYGALLTQSRGPLLSFVPAFALVLWLHARRSGRWRGSAWLAAAVLAGGAVATLTLHGQLVGRFAAIHQEMATYDHHSDADGSIRERLEMWRTAGRAFVEHPLLGIGIDRYEDFAHREIAAGRSNVSIAHYNQPHNEYLRALANGGVVQLLALLAMFALPLRYFARQLRDADDATAAVAWAGMAIVVLYVFCAIGDSVFYRVMSQSFFFFLVLGLAVRAGYLKQGAATHGSPSAARTL